MVLVIAAKVRSLRTSAVKRMVDSRLEEFERLHESGCESWFSELCFCLLTANTSFKLGYRIQQEFGFRGFTCHSCADELAVKLKGAGYRFYNRRAHFIDLACSYKDKLKANLLHQEDKRKWLVDNIKGLGYKESSHFLRNVGFFDYAILDLHILRLMEKDGMITRPKTMTPSRYLEFESKLNDLAGEMDMKPGELDLYLWYIQTGRVDK